MAADVVGQKDVPVDDLYVSDQNVRSATTDVSELEDSIEEHGVLEPIIVRPDDDGRYEVVVGSRRLTAAKAVGLDVVPAIIKELDDEEAFTESLVENLQRDNLEPDEQVNAVGRLYNILGSQRATAKAIGKSKRWVADQLKAKGIIDRVAPQDADDDSSGRHVDQGEGGSVLPRDTKKAARIERAGQQLFPEDEEKQTELFETLKNKSRDEVRRATETLKAKAEENPETIEKQPVEQSVEQVFKAPQVDVSVTFGADVSRGIIKVAA